MRTAIVYRLDEKTLDKEPIGVLVERRQTDRVNNDIGLLRRARKEFAETEEESRRIVIGACM